MKLKELCEELCDQAIADTERGENVISKASYMTGVDMVVQILTMLLNNQIERGGNTHPHILVVNETLESVLKVLDGEDISIGGKDI